MEQQEIQNALINTENNIEEAIQLLSNLSISTSQDLAYRYAQELITRFDSNTSREDAISITSQMFNAFYEEKTKQNFSIGPDETNLVQKLEVLLQDNSILKKAVVKMKEKCDQAARIELENQQLKAELQRERMTNYALRVHLENEIAKDKNIEKGPDVY
ncbi:unnamed protein product [Blepharisma stoltei]|uniref:Uncharacterized protein n=1 Tax=Blepharisma stoltei TaxID=1481888 RepID=A0AAU9J474_9CILI|nr:unnamed protein product [Blepharisma stoltei]